MRAWWVLAFVVGCSGSKGTVTPPGGSGSGSGSGSAAPTGSDAGGTTYGGAPTPPPPAAGAMYYMSDCSLTHPIARDTCSGPEPDKRGLPSCSSLHITESQACDMGAKSCYVERTCSDGRVVAADYLYCSESPSSRCLTKSSRAFKDDITYLSDAELADLATQIEQLKVARYRYKTESAKHLGFIIEDAPDAPWVTEDGRRVDLYSLLTASIAAIQQQDARIRQLERDIQACKR